jgi:hypothetical protein
MEAIQIKCQNSKPNARRTVKITTTLYDLMETVIDVADPDESKLINEVTLNILAKAKTKTSNHDH